MFDRCHGDCAKFLGVKVLLQRDLHIDYDSDLEWYNSNGPCTTPGCCYKTVLAKVEQGPSK